MIIVCNGSRFELSTQINFTELGSYEILGHDMPLVSLDKVIHATDFVLLRRKE